jgi:hypothetical protein
MTEDEQARARLVEISEKDAALWLRDLSAYEKEYERRELRQRAGLRDPSKGSWCTAGITAAMEDAGLVVPKPKTPARRGAIALLDFVWRSHRLMADGIVDVAACRPGDIIAWLQHLPPDPKGWRRGHVAVIVAVDDVSITTVGWNEGPKPGRVMKRRLWLRDDADVPQPSPPTLRHDGYFRAPLPHETVLWRRPGGLYGIARPVAR